MTDFFEQFMLRFRDENAGSIDVEVEPTGPRADHCVAAVAVIVAILIFKG